MMLVVQSAREYFMTLFLNLNRNLSVRSTIKDCFQAIIVILLTTIEPQTHTHTHSQIGLIQFQSVCLAIAHLSRSVILIKSANERPRAGVALLGTYSRSRSLDAG